MIEKGHIHTHSYTPAVLEPRLLNLIHDVPQRRRRKLGLARLAQHVELTRLDMAAEIGLELPQPPGGIPLVSALAIQLRRWLTSDTERRLDAVLQRQVAYNRQLAQALHELDELSAAVSEQLAAHSIDKPG
jgi:hypothetical protein